MLKTQPLVSLSKPSLTNLLAQVISDGLVDETEYAPDYLYNPDDPIGWIERHFFIPETNAPIVLMDYQRAVIQEALRKDEYGNFVYSIILYSDIKKSAKSTIAAAVCLFLAWHMEWETVRIVGNDLKQADSRTFYYIERAIILNPELRDRCKVNRYHIELPNHTSIDAIPVDPKGEAGGGDLVTCFTELWAFKNDAAQKLWSETTLSPLKFGQSLRWCESYAGFTDNSPILERLYESGVTNGSPLNVGIDGLELFVNSSARMLSLWNTTPRCDWQTDAYYEQERAVLDESEFQRIHRNQWQSFKGLIFPSFDPILNVSEEAEYNPGLPIIWGVDDGYAQGRGIGTDSYHPRVILLGQITAQGGINIFAEYAATLELAEKSLDKVLEWPYPHPEIAYVDSSAVELLARIHERDISATGATHPVQEGIKNVRRLICNGVGVRLLKIHPRCTGLRYEMQRYRYADSGQAKGGEQNPLKTDDHTIDALRYAVWHLRFG